MTLTIPRYHIAITIAVLLIAISLGFWFWLQSHDAQIRERSREQASQDTVNTLLKSNDGLKRDIQTLKDNQAQADAKAESDRIATRQMFAGANSIPAMAALFAKVSGMQSTPQTFKPGENPALPEGGEYLNPVQVKAKNDYAAACEDCKLERDNLHSRVDTLTQTVAKQDITHANDVQVITLREQTIKDLNKQLRRGWRYRLEDVLVDCLSHGATGAVASAMGPSNPIESKPVLKASTVGCGLGVFKNIVFRH